MKKLIVLMIASFIPVIILAQNTPLALLYDKYTGKPGFEAAEIFPGSFSFAWEKIADNNMIKEMLKDIETIRILKYDAAGESTGQQKLWKKMAKAAGDELYKKVVTVNAENIRVNIYMIKDTGGKTREVALLAKHEKGIVMMTIDGNIDFSSMFSSENIESLRKMAEYYLKNKVECKPANN